MGFNGWGFNRNWPDIANAVKAGFFDVKYVRKPSNPGAICFYCNACTMTIVPAARQYIKSEKNIGDVWDKQRKEIALNGFDGVSVDVSGMTQPATAGGRSVVLAEFEYTLTLNPLGTALRKSSGNPSRQGKAVFVLYDDGWRVEEVKLDEVDR